MASENGAELVVKFKDARLRARSGDYLLGLVQAFQVESPYAIIISVVLTEELRVRVDVDADALGQELQNWLDGVEMNNPVWVGSMPRTNAAMDCYVKFGKPPSQEDLIKWILSRCELDIGPSPGMFFGSRRRASASNEGKETDNAIRTKEGGALVENPYEANVRAAQVRGGPISSSLPNLPSRALATATKTHTAKQMEAYNMTQKILGKSNALEKMRSEPVKGEEKIEWTTEHRLLGAYIERGRKSVESAMDERRRAIAVANSRKQQSVKRYVDVREEIEGSAGSARWLKEADEELKKLQRIEKDVQDDLRRQRGKAHREKQATIWSLAPNGYANLRGKSLPGPKLGDGPLPADATSALRDPRRDNAEKHFYWDSMGRKHEKDADMMAADEEGEADLVKSAMEAIKKAATSASAYKLDMKSVFSAMDTSGDGFLDDKELMSALASLGVRLRPDQEEAIFRHFDPDNSGMVHYGEFCWAFFNRRSLVRRWARNTQGVTDAQMRAIFHACDTNNDGKLGSKEFKKLLTSLNVTLSDGDRELIMTQFDEDGDGKLDLKEFKTFIEGEQAELKKTAEAAKVKAAEVPVPKCRPRPTTTPGMRDRTLAATGPQSGTKGSDMPSARQGELSVTGMTVHEKTSQTRARKAKTLEETQKRNSKYNYDVQEVYGKMVREAEQNGDDQTWVINALKAQCSIESKLGSRYYGDE